MDQDYYDLPDATANDQDYEVFDLKLDDGKLIQMVDRALTDSIDHWKGYPYRLDKADTENIRYWLGDQMKERYISASGEGLPNMGNRLQTSSRAVLAYVNSRVAQPEVRPSTSDKGAIQYAKDVTQAMYQHGVDHDLATKAKKSTTNLVIQKRGFLKLRFDPLQGAYGDIEVEHISPENIVIDKDAGFKGEPRRIWHKQKCTIEELISKFSEKEEQIKLAFGIGRGVYTQMSKIAEYWEVWFTFYEKGNRKEGLCWYLPTGKVILGKMLNPNFVYTGDDQKDREINFTAFPIKPFIGFNYMNTGKAYIDETSLFEQAKVLQDLYNKRKKQIMDNNDYVNGRVIADGNALEQEDATKYLNKGAKTILLIKPSEGKTVQQSVYHVPYTALPNGVVDEAYDVRNEIDQTMGTPNIFRGEQSKNNTLGQDERIIQQAGALQDDLASSVDESMQDYYRKLYQMMKVYYTEDHWFQIKGSDGKYDFVVMNSDTMDTNLKISVEAGSTLPSNKKEVRDIAVEASNAGKMDSLSYWEAIQYGKLPDPETIVERTQKELNDPASFVADVEQQAFNRDADIDITLLIADKEPPVRDEYGQAYLEHVNKYIMGNKFVLQDKEAQKRIIDHLTNVGVIASRTADLQDTQVDDAQMAGMEEQQVNELPV